MPTIAYDALSRRDFVGLTGATAAAFVAGRPLLADSPAGGARTRRGGKRPRIAAVFTEFRFRSHAYNILENFFEPYLFRGKLVDPGVEVVSFYADQFPEDDMARDVARRFGVPLYKSIDQALCLGGKKLAVDGVLSIGEHGDYPVNERGQTMYPRKRFFDESVAVMKRSGRFVPVFNDKHLSYRWDWAKEMYDMARRHGMPLMAGSSVPLAQRVPAVELPEGAEIEEAVAIHGGGIETYDFHGLEVLQSIIEARQGGETGVSSVALLSGDLFRGAVKEGRWSESLVEAALAAEKKVGLERQPRPAAGRRVRDAKKREADDKRRGPHALVVTYTDGLRATVLKVGSNANRWNFACRLRGEKEPRATSFYNGPWGNRCLFKALSHAIQHLFIHRAEPYPAERTLLVSGVLDAAMRSHQRWGRPVETPHLELAYRPADFRAFRETGASWKVITRETPQPVEFSPGDRRFLRPAE